MTKDEADNALRKAIMDHAEAYDLAENYELLDQYAVIAFWQKLVDTGSSNYTIHFHTPHIPAHSAFGLFKAAEQLVLEQRFEDDDE